MNPATARRAAAPRPPTATDRVYDGIYRAIVAHRLAPGARLREEELAESFAVSRTVVRQALQRLAQDQIVDLRHNHGAQVPQPGLEDAAPVFDARRVVEGEIARRLGDCQLVFFAPNVPQLMQRLRDRLARRFADAGVDFSATVAIVPWQDRASFHGLLSQADVYLDTLGFSGFNSALQAIECGLPVAAWEGRFLRGRLASGILRRMGLDELVAGAEADYVRIAVRLAQDAAYWGEVRERMVAGRAGLYGDEAPVRALERFLEGAVRA